MIHTQRERERTNKPFFFQKKEIQIFVPCCNPRQMEKGPTMNTKISQFLYIKLPLVALVQEHARLSGEPVSRENLYF